MKTSRRTRVTHAAVALTAGLAVLSAAAVCEASWNFPNPGTPGQVASLVASSHTIEKLPSNILPSLADAPYDNTAKYFRATRYGCTMTTQCVYGDTTSPTTVVLFGDSHAAMWLPPLYWVGRQLKLKVVLLWRAGCPAADVTVWNASSHSPDAACTAFRSASLAAIEHLKPALVALSERTNAVRGSTGALISNAAWQTGLETTIGNLRKAGDRVAVIGDVVAMTNELPQCLAAFQSSVQRCGSPNPNPAMDQHFAAEQSAAAAKGASFISPRPWLCTNSCSPVIGNMVVYYDSEHVAATYAYFLAQLFEAALKPLV